MTTLTENAASTIMARLKESTQKLHDATEDGAFNRDLVKGTLPQERYVESLAQLLLIHQSLEAHLKTAAEASDAVRAVLKDYLFQEPYLEADLTFFKYPRERLRALPATAALIREINRVAAIEPVGLLGFLYVFEGSNNGSKFISKAVRKAYGLTEGPGTSYLDPYGERQRECWQRFKDDMNAVIFTESQTEAILNAAARTFAAVMTLHRELHAAPRKAAPENKPTGGCPFQQSGR